MAPPTAPPLTLSAILAALNLRDGDIVPDVPALVLLAADGTVLRAGHGGVTLSGTGAISATVADRAGVAAVLSAGQGGPLSLAPAPSAPTGATAGDDLLLGGAGSDSLLGGRGDDRAEGGDAADTLQGGLGSDTLLGGAGGDLLDGGAGTDWLDGGAGDDLYRVDDPADVVAELPLGGSDTVAAAVAGGAYALPAEVEALLLLAGTRGGLGNAKNNTLVGNAGDNLLAGGEGDDSLLGGAGDDALDGEAGDDTVLAGDGADAALGGDGADALRGEAGDDTLLGEAGEDALDGGDGADWLHGGDAADTLGGGDGADALLGGAGDDSLAGGAGGDGLLGGDGGDMLDGGAGADWMDGGAGSDLFRVDDASDEIAEAANGGYDWLTVDIAGGGYALRSGVEVESLTLLGATVFALGNEAATALTGNAAANLLAGGAGEDTLAGHGGDDTLFGGEAADLFTFAAGDGRDLVADYGAEDRLVIAGASHVTARWADAGTVRFSLRDAWGVWRQDAVELRGDFGGPGGFVLGAVDVGYADLLIDAGAAPRFTQAGPYVAWGGVVLVGDHVGADGGPGRVVLQPPIYFGSDFTRVTAVVPFAPYEPAPPVDVPAIEARLATLTDTDGTAELVLIG